MASRQLMARVRRLSRLVGLIGPALTLRKLNGILAALEIQIEEGDYQPQAVVRLCEALLATAERYDIPEGLAAQIEEAACALVSEVEARRR